MCRKSMQKVASGCSIKKENKEFNMNKMVFSKDKSKKCFLKSQIFPLGSCNWKIKENQAMEYYLLDDESFYPPKRFV